MTVVFGAVNNPRLILWLHLTRATIPANGSGIRKPDRIDRRQIRGDGLPGVSAIFADPERTCRRSKNEPVARLIHVESVAINQIVSVFLRQAAPQRLERLASVLGAVDHHAAIGWAALLVLSGGNKPRRVRIAGMDRDGKTEYRGLQLFDLGPRRSAVG